MSAALTYDISYSLWYTAYCTYCNRFYITVRFPRMFKAFEERTGLQYRSVEEQTARWTLREIWTVKLWFN